jgi:hypothetical protein
VCGGFGFFSQGTPAPKRAKTSSPELGRASGGGIVSRRLESQMNLSGKEILYLLGEFSEIRLAISLINHAIFVPKTYFSALLLFMRLKIVRIKIKMPREASPPEFIGDGLRK